MNDDPRTTGQVALLLDGTEPRIADLVRRGKIDPPPPIVAGRRLWHRQHILQAAMHLGVPTDELNARLEKEVLSHG